MKLRIVLAFAILGYAALAADSSPIYPEPQQWKLTGSRFEITPATRILLPAQASPGDLQLARILAGDFADRYRIGVRIERVSALPALKGAIVMGAVSNPLVKASMGAASVAKAEGYSLTIGANSVVVAGDDESGAFYGVQSLRQLIRKDGNRVSLMGIEVRDWPAKPFRGIKLYLPGRDNLPFFRRFAADFMALYKFNKLILEVNAGMRFDRHPELNAGWIELGKDLNYTRRDRPAGPRGEFQDSSHQDTADGGTLEKGEVADLVRLANQNHIEVIPEIPSLTHSYYLLTRHRELAEVPTAEWPDTYCPLNPKSYDLLFDVLDEYIEVMHTKMIHVGHDEWRNPIDLCPRCRDKDHTELFIQDINRIHDYLANKHIRMAIWGDHLIEPLRGKKLAEAGRAGARYQIPGALSEDQVIKSIPKDILIFNWFWNDQSRAQGEINDRRLARWGFQQVYGNFTPGIIGQNYKERRERTGVLGGTASSWAATTEFNFGKDLIFEMLGTAPLLWSNSWPTEANLMRIVQNMMPEIRFNLSGRNLPSQDALPTVSAALPGMPANAQWGKALVIRQNDTGPIPVIPINQDASSIIFQHAVAAPAGHEQAARIVYNPLDTSDLLGWYEIVYEDGLTESVPIRYGWNVLEWNWPAARGSASYCYECMTATDGNATFSSYEWVNPRLGKVIKEVRVHGSEHGKNLHGRAIADDPILLRSIRVVKKRDLPDPVRAQAAQ